MRNAAEFTALQNAIAANPDEVREVFLKYRIDPATISPRSVVLGYQAFGAPFLADIYPVLTRAPGRPEKVVSNVLGFGGGDAKQKARFKGVFDSLSTWLGVGSAVAGTVNNNIINPRQNDCPGCPNGCGSCGQFPPQLDNEQNKIFGLSPGIVYAGIGVVLLLVIFIIWKRQ
ncbi:MAG: hypothetical protein AAF570_04815 [Bacteroidota bacterium]